MNGINYSPMSTLNQPQRPYQCRSIFQLLYTFKRTKTLLESQGIAVERIDSVTITDFNGNFLNHIRCRYLTSQGQLDTVNLESLAYYELFQHERRNRALDYHARVDTDNPLKYIVSSTAKTEQIKPLRQVRLFPERLTCTCEDYSNMSLYLQQHPYLWWYVLQGGKLIACKHVHATLNTLSFSSVCDYLKAWQSGGRFVEYKQTKR